MKLLKELGFLIQIQKVSKVLKKLESRKIMNDALNEVLKGAIDLHAHTGPSIFPRLYDSIDLAIEAKEAGMRGITLKNHHGITSDRATLVSKAVPGIDVFGGVVLNRYSGGINPFSVEAAIRMGGKIVWFPTQWAKHHIKIYGAPEYAHNAMKVKVQYGKKGVEGISIFDTNGNLTPETLDVLQLVKENDIAIGSGHLSKDEIVALFKKGKEMGIKKMFLNHVTDSELWTWTASEQRELVNLGAFIEQVAIYIHPNRCLTTPEKVAEMIGWVGPKNILISSDCGTIIGPTSVQGLQTLVKKLLELGITRQDIDLMTKKNPAIILGLT